MSLCCPPIQAKVPRLKVSYASVRLTDLRETDEGTYSVSFREGRSRDIVKLKVLGEKMATHSMFKNYIQSENVYIDMYLEYLCVECHSSE